MIEDGYNDINAMRRKILKLKRELTQLREDRRVLGESIQLVQTVNEDGSVTTHIPSVTLNNGESFAVIRKSVAWKWLVEADASGALGRATPP